MPDVHSTRTYEFRGHTYRIACTEREGYQHPSWFSFEDESSVRDAFWDIKPDDVVLDVGAAYGSYTLTALACGARHVFAWSPEGPPGEANEADMLTQSLELNGWLERCTIFRQGCYDKIGWLNPATQDWTEFGQPGSIPVTLLDAFITHHSQLAKFGQQPSRVWMKLDVEGAELEVLRGAKALAIDTFRPRILVENHLFKRATIEDEVRALLTEYRYCHLETRPYHSVSHSLYEPI